jgi:O-antigen ligase
MGVSEIFLEELSLDARGFLFPAAFLSLESQPVKQSPRPSTLQILELCVVAQVSLFMIGVSWAFGGNADWVRTPVAVWGSVGIALFVASAIALFSEESGSRILAWAWPILALNGIVAASCLTPGLKPIVFGSEALLMPVSVPWWLPSSAQPAVTLGALWLFDGIYFSCLNVALLVVRRRLLRIVIAVVVANAVALAVFGTVQKLAGSTGIYFGAVKSPQVMFFSSFVYDNHWGAFAILMLCACTGLVIRYARRMDGRGFFNGPAFIGLVAVVLIGLSIPLSGSRACTILLCIAAVAALGKGLSRASRSTKVPGIAGQRRFFVTSLIALLAMCAVWLIAGEVIKARAEKTRDQLSEMWANGSIGSRAVLYRDTWRMARQRTPFGWGMGSFPRVFLLYNTQESKIDRIPVVYHDAHSDWLQSVAEIGFVGTLLIGAAAILPFMSVRGRVLPPIPFFLLTGCALVAAYAWVEFPFGNVAVCLAWWLCFFTAVQYTKLSVDRSGQAVR